MSKSRLLQQEIEKKLQQVEEGLLNFWSLHRRLQSSTSSSQKERLENELKKELKRLQKIRESFKSFESQEPRLRQRMIEAKKKIEDLMEVHKQSEKESKTLCAAAKRNKTPPPRTHTKHTQNNTTKQKQKIKGYPKTQ